jgi:hypothetical protein
MKCTKKRCKGECRNVSALMMGPHWRCEKCDTIYHKNGKEFLIKIGNNDG